MRFHAVTALALSSFCAISAFAVSPAVAAPQGTAPAARTRVVRDARQTPWLYVAPKVDVSRFANDAKARATSVLRAVDARAASAELRMVEDLRFDDGDRIVRFEQTHQGLPVVGAGAAVRFDRGQVPTLVRVGLASSLPTSVVPTIASGAAAAIASTRSPLAVTSDDAHLVVLRKGDTSHLAWAFVPTAPAGIPFAPRVLVDAHTGDVLQATDAIRYGSAQVYTSNPTTTPNRTMNVLPILPSGTTLENPFIKSQNCVDRKRVADVDFSGFKLKVHVCDLEQKAVANAGGDYEYTPNDDPSDVASRSDEYSEVSMYFHTTRAYKYFRDLVEPGNTTLHVTADFPLRTISNLQMPKGLMQGNIQTAGDPNTPLDPFQNAFFSPAAGGLGAVFSQLYGFDAGAMWFGQGPKRDYSYDGDVIAHEFTHAVVDDSLKLGFWHLDKYGAIDAPGAMNEGLADFFAAAITGDPNVGEYAVKDIDASWPYIRTLANEDAIPGSLIGEVHYDSTLFSGGLWDARSALPNDEQKHLFDRGIYKAMRANAGDGDLGYEDAVELFLASLETELPEGAALLRDAMTKRHVLPGGARTFTWNGKPILAARGLASTGSFAAPGTDTLGVKNLAPGMIQVKVDLPKGTTAFTVSFDEGRSAAQQNPFGGGAAFTPVVIAKLDSEVTWNTSKWTPVIDVQADAKKTGKTYQAELTLPEGSTATVAYVQIANKGADGAYDNLVVTTNAVAPSNPATVDIPSTPSGTATPGNGVAADPGESLSTLPKNDSGCGCSVPQRTTSPAAFVLALGGLAVLVRRRRR